MFKNTYGNIIHQGEKGGFFTVDSNGKKKYKVSFAYNSIEPKNSKGNVIHQGSKGGLYIIKGGKKIYNFSPIPKSQYPPILNKVKKTIIDDAIKWLDDNTAASTEEFEAKYTEVMAAFAPTPQPAPDVASEPQLPKINEDVD